jgi:hypothetical protein
VRERESEREREREREREKGRLIDLASLTKKYFDESVSMT